MKKLVENVQSKLKELHKFNSLVSKMQETSFDNDDLLGNENFVSLMDKVTQIVSKSKRNQSKGFQLDQKMLSLINKLLEMSCSSNKKKFLQNLQKWLQQILPPTSPCPTASLPHPYPHPASATQFRTQHPQEHAPQTRLGEYRRKIVCVSKGGKGGRQQQGGAIQAQVEEIGGHQFKEQGKEQGKESAKQNLKKGKLIKIPLRKSKLSCNDFTSSLFRSITKKQDLESRQQISSTTSKNLKNTLLEKKTFQPENKKKENKKFLHQNQVLSFQKEKQLKSGLNQELKSRQQFSRGISEQKQFFKAMDLWQNAKSRVNSQIKRRIQSARVLKSRTVSRAKSSKEYNRNSKVFDLSQTKYIETEQKIRPSTSHLLSSRSGKQIQKVYQNGHLKSHLKIQFETTLKIPKSCLSERATVYGDKYQKKSFEQILREAQIKTQIQTQNQLQNLKNKLSNKKLPISYSKLHKSLSHEYNFGSNTLRT